MAAKTPDNDENEPYAIPGDRRDFYRISDHIGLEIRRLGEYEQTVVGSFDGSHIESLHAEFRRFDQDLRSQLAILAERDRALTSLIKSLNGKIDSLARIMALEQNPLQPEDWQNVTLSEGGLLFRTDSSDYAVNDRLSMRLTLPPEMVQPLAIARVLSIEPDRSGGYRVHTEFVDIHDHDRQQIARHVLRWQIRQRQNA